MSSEENVKTKVYIFSDLEQDSFFYETDPMNPYKNLMDPKH